VAVPGLALHCLRLALSKTCLASLYVCNCPHPCFSTADSRNKRALADAQLMDLFDEDGKQQRSKTTSEMGEQGSVKGQRGNHPRSRPKKKANTKKWKYRCRKDKKIHMAANDPKERGQLPKHTASKCVSNPKREYCDLAPAGCKHSNGEVCDCSM